MNTSGFTHLHLHSAYSLLDGAIRLKDLAARAKEYGMNAVALTDHGNMFGIIDFYTTMKKAGIKPIIGCEIYITPGSRTDTSKRSAYHLILLAQNNTGYQNLIRLVSSGYMEGFYYHPRIDYEILEQFHEGIIATSACLGGEIPAAILNGQNEEARKIARRYNKIFGTGNFFLELQRNDLSEQERVNEEIVKIAREEDIPLVATNDCHYLNQDDKKAHEVLLCIQTGASIDDENRFSYESDSLYMRSGDEMAEIFSDYPDAIENTAKIAERCNVELDLESSELPKFTPPDGRNLDEYLVEITSEALEKRMDSLPYDVDRDQYRARLHEELEIIKSMGFPGYFLIVWDFIKFAHENDIPVGPGRGSGAGSLVAYALRITDLDPIPYNLIFERFLNPERVSMPDFDIDFCMNRRDEVIRYVMEKYGKDCVGQIITFNCMKAKAVIRDVGRVMNVPLGEVDKLAKLIPGDLDITLESALKKDEKLRKTVNGNPQYTELFSIAKRLEGLNRHAGVHAAGIVISENPLWETVPVKREGTDGIVTQYAKKEVEKAGLVKFDFLGLKTLTVIDIAQRLVNAHIKDGEEKLNIQTKALDDSSVYELISTGETYGIFQMESSGFQEMIKRMRPSCFEDIIAAVALYRPGPMEQIPDFCARKHGQQAIDYPHDNLKPILKDTYGLIVYQEQVMQISRVMAGFSLGHADLLRRAMGKKDKKEMAQLRQTFIKGDAKMGVPGAIPRGYDGKLAGRVFDLMEKFAGYGFNKSHAAGYALLSYQTAYLKRYHLKEFMAALMTCDREKLEKVVKAINECRRMNVEVLPPDVNTSDTDFTIVDEGIRFGLAAVKNVGISAVEAIIDARIDGGDFGSIFGFCRRVDLRVVNRRVLESLIKCGAMDGLEGNRSQFMEILETALSMGQKSQRDKLVGQASLFGSATGTETVLPDPVLPDVPEWPLQEMLINEKETLGFYVTGHPLLRVRKELTRFATHDSLTLQDGRDNDRVVIGGLVAGIKRYTTKRGEQMAFITMEDLSGLCEIIVRSALWATVRELLESDGIFLIIGFISSNETQMRVVADEIYSLEDGRRKLTRGLQVGIRQEAEPDTVIEEIRHVIRKYSGDAAVHLLVDFPRDTDVQIVTLDLGKDNRIDPTGPCIADLEKIAGTRIVGYW